MSSPRYLHPLMGVNPKTLFALLRHNGAGEYPVHLAIILSVALLRWPFSTYERWSVARSPLPESNQIPPIFIVGHWRSGTTFLHNLLCRSPQFSYIAPLATGLPWDFLTLGNLLRPVLEKALPEGRFIDKVAVNPDSPQEDEIALASMQLLSFYHGLYFPKNFTKNFNAGLFFEGCDDSEIEKWDTAMRHLYKKLRLQSPGRQLLIKNPVYTARVERLRSLWPQAKFIHIYRNPYTVYQSTLNFYDKLLPELSLQSFEQVPVSETILESYPKIMAALFEDTRSLAEKDFIELRFETFEADPIGQLKQVYGQLEIEGWESAEPLFQQYLDAQKSYRKNKYAFSPEAMQTVKARWQPFIERWGYDMPEGGS